MPKLKIGSGVKINLKLINDSEKITYLEFNKLYNSQLLLQTKINNLQLKETKSQIQQKKGSIIFKSLKRGSKFSAIIAGLLFASYSQSTFFDTFWKESNQKTEESYKQKFKEIKTQLNEAKTKLQILEEEKKTQLQKLLDEQKLILGLNKGNVVGNHSRRFELKKV